MGDLNGSALLPGGACAARARTSRARHNITYLYRHDDGVAESRLECDAEVSVVHSATLSVLLVLYVVVLLVGSSRVLSSPRYLVFDEWWGALRAEDNLPRVLGREAEAGHIRLSRSSVRRKWLTDDKRHAGGQRLAETD